VYTRNTLHGMWLTLMWVCLPLAVPNWQVLARSSPEDKLTLVSLLKHHGEVVAVTGEHTHALYTTVTPTQPCHAACLSKPDFRHSDSAHIPTCIHSNHPFTHAPASGWPLTHVDASREPHHTIQACNAVGAQGIKPVQLT